MQCKCDTQQTQATQNTQQLPCNILSRSNLPYTHVGATVPRPNLMRPLSINDKHATIINLLDARKQIFGGEGNTEHTMTQGRLFNFFIYVSRTRANAGTHAVENEWDRGEAKAICKHKNGEENTKQTVTFMRQWDRGEAKAICKHVKGEGNTKQTVTVIQEWDRGEAKAICKHIKGEGNTKQTVPFVR